METYAVFLNLLIISMANCSNILMIFPTAAPSHFFLGNTLAKGLLKAGHEITMVSSYEDKSTKSKRKYTTVLLDGMERALIDSNLPTWKEFGSLNSLLVETTISQVGYILTNFTVNHPNFRKLIHSDRKFDVIILEQFLNDGLKILSCHFKAPLISFSTFGTSVWTNSVAGNPSPASYIPDAFSSYTTNMNLIERTINSMIVLFRYLNGYIIVNPTQGDIVKNHFPECYRHFNEILYNVSLTFLNTHESINFPVPLVPSMVPIGGYHLTPPRKLPDDLKTFMDEAEDGVVYFSLGTNIVPSSIGIDAKDVILRVFGKLKQRVLWKWDEDLVGIPGNVKIQKFFPQQDVLAHPNIKLFITHGGLLSSIETVYHGVPVLSIPVFGDQKMNSARMERDGFGLFIPLSELSEENLTEALKKLLNDPKYRENVKRRSILLRDRPMNPMDLAIYWTEFVIRHKGASHLRVAALDIAWYQYLLLDVVGVVIICLFSVALCIFYLLKILFKIVRKSTKIKIN